MSIAKISAMMPMKAHSERVPGKNVRLLAGRPLFHWMLEALRGSKYIGEILINTDSADIGREAERLFGARYIPRPAHLLGDHVSMTPLIEYDLSQCDATVMLQTHATNPLITTATVDRVIERYFEKGEHDSVFTVNTFHSRFYWHDGTPANHDLSVMLRTQDLPPLYEENSCLYVFSRESFRKSGRRIGDRPLLVPTDALESIDIDEEHHFRLAEALMKNRLADAR